MSEKGKILLIPLCSQGHVNFLITLAKGFLRLYGDKHEVHFAVDQEYSDKIQKQVSHPSLKTHVYESALEKEKKDDGDKHWLVEMMQQYGDTWSTDSVKYVHESAPIFNMMFESLTAAYDDLTKIVNEVKPSIIIYDQLFATPVGQDQGIPWANFFSCAINFVGLKGMPPPQSGLPTEWNAQNEKQWEDFIDRAYRQGPWRALRDKCNEFLKSKGAQGIPEDGYMCYKPSPYLNLYGYPKELDYVDEPNFKFPQPGAWLRIETPVLPPFPAPYPVPETLKNKPGKLIYFSLGSMATVYKPLMTKMLRILAQLPHRFIVSKGMIGHEYDSLMADNMCGENYLNQNALLQSVSMIISHGGNNTLTESFNFGVPLIITPLFGDQQDNAQRIHERGLGRRVCIFDEEPKLKQDLEEAIEYCGRESVVLKMKKISERIQKDSGLDRVCQELAKYCEKKTGSN